ncbi:hypothetical protein [Pseudodesulfovibrio piezophilus]|uniref:Uncharacterized protein n=1 Tax=Pseudodesulfovibrio piezophilus (strain DSM 21447 / JCM 15486 / C1TLV30) TaxID=1322246 RepID=M1WLC0_PSEP2|nr:hypothetical protein [Pseudodesulfovibrio piezophilus]CCH47600.1 conserved protein of unknown function [Pseudodesulfovibrio piezophilus C1TLV30]
MAEIKQLPGTGCLHHETARCFYQEHLNPGYYTRWRCRVLVHWGDAYDDFLDRVGAFKVDDSSVPDLWERQFQRLARDVFHCLDYTHAPNNDIPHCVYVVDGLCLLSLPKCTGRCRHFRLDRSRQSI